LLALPYLLEINTAFGESMNGSMGQQFIHAEWEAIATREKQGTSYPRKNSEIQGHLDS